MRFVTFTKMGDATFIELLVEFYNAAKRAGLLDFGLPSALNIALEEARLDEMITDEMLDSVRCLTCLSVCLPPTLGCKTGHLLCDDCQTILLTVYGILDRCIECPVCHDDLGAPRHSPTSQ